MSDRVAEKANVSALTSLLACLFYGFVSTSITFFNKAVLASYDFKSPNIMTLFQVLFSLVFLVGMKQLRLIHYPNITWQTSLKVRPAATAAAYCEMRTAGREASSVPSRVADRLIRSAAVCRRCVPAMVCADISTVHLLPRYGIDGPGCAQISQHSHVQVSRTNHSHSPAHTSLLVSAPARLLS